MKIKIPFCIGLFFCLSSTAYPQSMKMKELNSDWQFRKAGESKWMRAVVPGCVHTDLLSNNKIEDPFYGDNEKKLHWIDSADWEYQTSFDCDSALFMSKHIDLRFDGLDTYAKVYLNDQLILSADNMFRTWSVDCKPYLKTEGNMLTVRFESAERKGKALAKKLAYTLPGEERSFTRKAAYQYGWDFSPRFLSCGIWRPVKIVGWNLFRIDDVRFIQDELTDTKASVVAEVSVTTDEPTTVFFKVLLNAGSRDSLYYEQPVQRGENILNLPITIKNPKKWWCNGMGDPYLYHISIQFSNALAQSEIRNIPLGLRTIQLAQDEDTLGSRFYFRLNGVPVFMKGANYVPADNFPSRVSADRYKEIIQSAVDANMNMLRVWGGGIYEDDEFYNLCDEKGILIWQDLMFANTMYPGDTAFLENVKQEVADNVSRLRNHASIALWCGNNEIEEGWDNWGWQEQYHYSKTDSVKIHGDYQKLQDVLSKVLDRVDPVRPYWPSSPSVGWGHEESFWRGDSHYWGVWWGNEPFGAYEEKIGRFVDEYGFQSLPAANTFRKFTDEKELSLESPAVKHHQKHPKGFATIQSYMDKQFRHPKDFESYIYVSQLMQAEGIRTAIEAHRRDRPHCMGSLFWQLNDCWPGISWSSTDYFGTWKALQYAARNAYEKILVSPVVEDHKLVVYIINDSHNKMPAVLDMKLMDFNGTVLWSKNVPVNVLADSTRIYFNTDSVETFKNIDLSKAVLSVKLMQDPLLVSENVLYFVPEKDMNLSTPQISYTFGTRGKQTTVELESKSLAKNVFIDFADAKVKLSDNYFDLLPGQRKTVELDSYLSSGELTKKIKIKSLADSY